MYCSKCGFQNVNGERFCKNCGVLLENNQSQQMVNNINSTFQQPMNNNMNGQPINNIYQQPMNNNMNGQPINNMYQQPINQQYTNTYGNLDPNYIDKAVNPNMKKWAILSIVVPVAGIIWYWFIGLSFYLAILIAATGFGFAEKGKMADKKLSIIGKVCSGILVGMAVVMFIMNLILVFNS